MKIPKVIKLAIPFWGYYIMHDYVHDVWMERNEKLIVKFCEIIGLSLLLLILISTYFSSIGLYDTYISINVQATKFNIIKYVICIVFGFFLPLFNSLYNILSVLAFFIFFIWVLIIPFLGNMISIFIVTLSSLVIVDISEIPYLIVKYTKIIFRCFDEKEDIENKPSFYWVTMTIYLISFVDISKSVLWLNRKMGPFTSWHYFVMACSYLGGIYFATKIIKESMEEERVEHDTTPLSLLTNYIFK